MDSTDKLLRLSDVSEKTTLAKSTIWLKISQGKFPQPTKISPAINVWRESDIDDWVNAFFGSGNSKSDK